SLRTAWSWPTGTRAGCTYGTAPPARCCSPCRPGRRCSPAPRTGWCWPAAARSGTSSSGPGWRANPPAATRRSRWRRSRLAAMTAPDFSYTPMLPRGADTTEYRLVTDDGIDVVNGPGRRSFLTVAPEALTALTAEAMHDIAHFLRPAH